MEQNVSPTQMTVFVSLESVIEMENVINRSVVVNAYQVSVIKFLFNHLSRMLQNAICYITAGFRGDGIDCSQSQSCLQNKNVCHENAECLSTGVCQCKRGFIGDGTFCNAGTSVIAISL